MSRGNGGRHRMHANPFTIRGEIERPDWQGIYGRKAPLALDVGFGPGMFLVEMAKKWPQWNALGLEIRQHFVDGVLRESAKQGVENLHAMLINANTQLDDLIEDDSVAFVSVNFPDPWFKKRHQKRRVVRNDWLDLMSRKLQIGGEFHYVSDFDEGAHEALELLREHGCFEAAVADEFLEQSTTDIITEREITHGKRGDTIYRLLYRCIARAPAGISKASAE